MYMSVLALFLFIHLYFRCLLYQSISKKFGGLGYKCICLYLRFICLFTYVFSVSFTSGIQEEVWRAETTSAYVCTCALSVYSLLF